MHIRNTQYPKVELSPFNPKGDLPIVEKWLKCPHVARWWGDPSESLDAVRNHDTSASALILVDGTPVGYLCWQIPTPEELADAGLADLPSNLVDIDIMIGESTALGHGYGPKALSQLLCKLGDEGTQIVGMATAESNKRAGKAFDKAGFRLFRSFTEQGEKMRYMTRLLHPVA